MYYLIYIYIFSALYVILRMIFFAAKNNTNAKTLLVCEPVHLHRHRHRHRHCQVFLLPNIVSTKLADDCAIGVMKRKKERKINPSRKTNNLWSASSLKAVEYGVY